MRRGLSGRADRLARLCERALTLVEASLEEADQHYEQLLRARDRYREQREQTERRRKDLERKQAELREEQHRTELRRTEINHELARVADRLRDELGTTPDEVLATYPGSDGEERRELEERAAQLTERIEALGTVNPLAPDEYEQFKDRCDYLSAQLEDIKASRRDLARVIRAVDERIEEVFADAFADVSAAFAEVFAILFPGGRGRLVLTDPNDLQKTGIEVQARPAGKKVSRLSLLSGGERALASLALLFAIFRARPSPFYVLDEVEAALDDINLARLLSLFESFRERSQLLVVTHQKPTMEIADVLYGITMGNDGVSTVIAERSPAAARD